MVIGDLNSNARLDVWDRWWNHSDVVKELANLGLNSLYHEQTGQAQGAEEKPYHIDYAFVSAALRLNARIEVGEINPWLEYSDHLPLVIDMPKL